MFFDVYFDPHCQGTLIFISPLLLDSLLSLLTQANLAAAGRPGVPPARRRGGGWGHRSRVLLASIFPEIADVGAIAIFDGEMNLSFQVRYLV